MTPLMERISQTLAEALAKVLKTQVDVQDLEAPANPEHGDFAFPCFKLAKELRKAPPLIAREAADKLRERLPTLSVEALGPYINFKIPVEQAAAEVLPEILKGEGLGKYGQRKSDSRGTWVLEYSSPNVAKPFQIYHLRGTVLGATLRRIGKYRGFKVEGINHLGDWGSQFGKQAVAMQLYKDELPKDPGIMDLVHLYVKFHQAAEEDPKLEDAGREAFVRLEKEDPEITALWKRCIDISLAEFKRIYQRIGVDFDHYWGESKYLPFIDAMLEEFYKKGILHESEGAQVVFVKDAKGKEIPPAIMVKKDGATIYATRDVAAARYRFEKFQFDRMTYIVGQEQKMHFVQVFDVLRQAGNDWYTRCEHIPTGLYRFKDAKMSTRKGNFVTLEDVLSEAKDKVREIVRERAKDFSPEELEDLTEKVAIGAVIFNDLSTDPTRDVQFELDRIVDFDGETGPYLQYAHTRCLSILRKAGLEEGHEFYKSLSNLSLSEKTFKAPEEERLIKTLAKFPVALEAVIARGHATQLSNYLIDVTKAFNAFYRECHVLEQEPEVTESRLKLVEATRRILGRGLQLLGVPLPERM